jgi:hypothetical protein
LPSSLFHDDLLHGIIANKGDAEESWSAAKRRSNAKRRCSVSVPDKNIAKGFHTKDEFDQYIQTFGIRNPDWQTPDEAYKKFAQTGCLDWIPDCK